jgi:hypothetical protein
MLKNNMKLLQILWFSVSHPFLGDYVRLRQNVQWKKMCVESNDQYVVFADIINKIARSSGKVWHWKFKMMKKINFYKFSVRSNSIGSFDLFNASSRSANSSDQVSNSSIRNLSNVIESLFGWHRNISRESCKKFANIFKIWLLLIYR